MANLKKLFPEFYQTDLKVSDLGKQTDNLIVLDTNYLLDIIQLPTTVSKKYIEALEKVKESIYVPYLVALEFNFKKSSIKKEKIKNIKKYKDSISNSISVIKDSIKSIDLVDDSEKEEFTEEILELTETFSENLSDLVEKKVVSIITKEEAELYEKLLQIIEEKIGDKYDQEWINKIEQEGEERYKRKIPPGFDDSSKENEEEAVRHYGDIEYQRKYGDLLIWKEIIEYSKKCGKSGKKVIFVTNDGKSMKKADLLYKASGLIVGPNIHLMNELQSESNKELHILNNLRFIQLVNDLSDAEISKLKVSSEQLYRVKIPQEKIEEELKHLKELNSQSEEFEFGIDNEGYLFRRKRIMDDKDYGIENEIRENYLRNFRNEIMHENDRDFRKFKKKIDSDDFEILNKRMKYSEIEDYLTMNKQLDEIDKRLVNDEIKNDFLNYYKAKKENRYLGNDFE